VFQKQCLINVVVIQQGQLIPRWVTIPLWVGALNTSEKLGIRVTLH